MAGHRRHEQNLAGAGVAACDAEVDQIAKVFGDDLFDFDQVIFAVIGKGANAPIRFDGHALKRALGYFAPSGHPLQRRVWHHAKDRVGCQ